jgi:hypothetical protein
MTGLHINDLKTIGQLPEKGVLLLQSENFSIILPVSPF